jgi:hypothetical protein
MLNIVFEGESGFVSDLGCAMEVRSATGEFAELLPRYGVWQLVRGKYQVVHTTHDLEEAKALVVKENA